MSRTVIVLCAVAAGFAAMFCFFDPLFGAFFALNVITILWLLETNK